MLTANNLSKRFGDTPILNEITFTLNNSERVGLIGPNGSGKSTLLQVLTGEQEPDIGSVSTGSGVTIGYLSQGIADNPNGTLADLLDGPSMGLLRAHSDLDNAFALYGDPTINHERVAAVYDAALDKFEAAGGYRALDELGALLSRFGLDNVPFDSRLSTLSGGQKTRAGLAALLTTSPDVLILDEPTNHLDIDALTWLQAFLNDYRGAVIVASHDRGFLDAVVTRILELDVTTRAITSFVGTFSNYVAAKRHEESEQAAAYARQQKDIARIEEDIRGTEHHARTIEANTIDFAVRKKAAKIARPAVVRKKKLERLLESADNADKPKRTWGMSVEFNADSQGSRDVVVVDGATLGYGRRAILCDVTLHITYGERVAILGPNGGGKSTLIRSITGELSPLAGTVRLGSSIKAGYFAQEQDTLDPHLTVMEQVRKVSGGSESDLRTFLHKFLFGGEMVHRQISTLSYGERARLMLAILVLHGANLLVLDEPLNHLDLTAREEFEQALESFEGTMLLVLHDRFAIERLATRVVEVRDGRVAELAGELAATT